MTMEDVSSPTDAQRATAPLDRSPQPPRGPGEDTSLVGLAVCGHTHVGKTRKENEDQYLIAELDRSMQPVISSLAIAGDETSHGVLLVVADGMGGHAGGALASETAVRAVAAYTSRMLPWLPSLRAGRDERLIGQLERALEHAQQEVIALGHSRGRLSSNMGTTLTMAYIADNCAHIVHAGDSRCYLRRDGRLWQISTDHTVAQQLVDGGAMTQSEADHSNVRHVLHNCIGGGDDRLAVELHKVALCVGDQLLLCTDGLTGHVSDAAIGEILAAHRPSAACAALVDAALSAGGHDNITVIVGAVESCGGG